LPFPDGRTKPNAAKGGKRSLQDQARDGYYATPQKMQNPVFYASRVAGFFFLSFFRKLRKRKENPIDPVNPVR
jgi:hypothetical protein